MNDQLQNPQLEGGSYQQIAGSTGILLFHGFGATTAEVRPLADYLFQLGFSVSCPLLPGHGTSTDDINKRHWQEWLEAGEAAYQSLKAVCENIIVAGESMGGLVTLQLGTRHPEITGLMLFAPALRIRYTAGRVIATVLSPFTSTIKKPASAAGPGDKLWQGYKVYALRAMRQLFSFQKNTIEKLPGVTQPTLIVHGRNDRSVHPDVPGMIAQKINSEIIEIHWMNRSGHCVIIDAEKEAVFHICQNFIQRIT